MILSNKRHTIQRWMVPKRDEYGQWWWGYQKIRMIVLPEEEKLAFIEKMTRAPLDKSNKRD